MTFVDGCCVCLCMYYAMYVGFVSTSFMIIMDDSERYGKRLRLHKINEETEYSMWQQPVVVGGVPPITNSSEHFIN